MDLIQVIREAIEASGETRYRIAKRAGVAESQLSRLQSGERGVSIQTVERLAEALDLEIVVRPKKRRNPRGR